MAVESKPVFELAGVGMSARFLILLFSAACAAAAAAAQDDDIRTLTEEARKLAVDLVAQVRGEVVKEMEHGGPLRSVIVCKYSAPEITSALSRKSGMHVSRVSLRARNPSLGWPDAWEQKVLMDFDRRAAQGEKVESIEHVEVVSEPQGRFLRYMKAIPTAAACLTCHGPAESLSDAVKAQIAGAYPHDKATGYAVGQVRGAVTVKRPF
jgi:hypothetical protein